MFFIDSFNFYRFICILKLCSEIVSAKTLIGNEFCIDFVVNIYIKREIVVR